MRIPYLAWLLSPIVLESSTVVAILLLLLLIKLGTGDKSGVLQCQMDLPLPIFAFMLS